jgi:hypothetical protein
MFLIQSMIQLHCCYSDIKFCRGFVEPFSDDREEVLLPVSSWIVMEG